MTLVVLAATHFQLKMLLALLLPMTAALLLPLTAALSPSDTFPSCLEAGLSWDESGVSSLTTNVTSPEACQKLCDEALVCLGFTWLSADFPILRLSCLLFEKTDTEIPCQHCVSGTERCSCSVLGECEVIDNNLVDVAGGVESASDCEEFCIVTKGCNFYTYFGNDNPLRHTCFLFNTCDAYVSECNDCMSGMPECNICNFEDTLADGSCDKGCDDGWASFKDACYIILNNNHERYNHIDVCREECAKLGGSLGSIHSAEENTFIYNLLRPARSGLTEQLTWLGAEWVSGYTFRWEDGTHWDYTNWESGEPDDTTSCVFMGYDPSSPDKWVDGVCDYHQAVFDCLCKILL